MEPLTRRETLDILSCMGVELPRTTRLPDDVLDKRLRDALNHAQHRSGLPPSSLDPARLPRWPAGEPLLKVLRRVDLGEALAIEDAERAGKAYERELFQDVFWDLGQTMVAIGKVRYWSDVVCGPGPAERDGCDFAEGASIPCYASRASFLQNVRYTENICATRNSVRRIICRLVPSDKDI